MAISNPFFISSCLCGELSRGGLLGGCLHRGRSAALARQQRAVEELESTALPSLDDNESLAQKSFEAGEIDLGELLLLRREILETRLVYLDRLLDAALTRVELEAAAGVLQ